MQTAGSQGPNIDFTLELTDCILDNETDYSKVTVKFTGQMDAAGTLWASTGTASNIGVLFQNASGENLQINDTVEQSLNAGTNVINLSARMQSLGAATAGSVKSTVAYVLDYK